MIRKMTAAFGVGLASFTLTGAATAQLSYENACASDAAGGIFNCGCVKEKFTAATADLTPKQTSILSDVIARSLGDTSIANPDPMDTIQIADQLMVMSDIASGCLSDSFHQDVADAEAAAEKANAEADAAMDAEKARTDAIPTAPLPPEITDADNYPALAGAPGRDAATEFRDYVIADCRSFGNSAGYCGCYADATEDMMTPEQTRAYEISSQVNHEADRGLISIDDMDQEKARRLGVSERQVREYAAQWNAMVSSQAYQDIHFACEAYR